MKKFVNLAEVNPEFSELPQDDSSDDSFNYILEVYTDDYIALATPRRQAQLHHVTNGVMAYIHDVFRPDDYD